MNHYSIPMSQGVLVDLVIQVYHYMLSSGKANICGSLEMSLFYLLSGFGLALRYGQTALGGGRAQDGEEGPSFGPLKFFRIKLFLIVILSFPLIYTGQSFFEEII